MAAPFIRQLLLLGGILLGLAACANLGSRPTPVVPVIFPPCTESAPPGSGLPIAFTIVTTGEGTGNPLWTSAYIDQLLASASTQVTRPEFFQLTARTEQASDAAFALEQVPLIEASCLDAPSDHVTALVSNPTTTLSAGAVVTTSGPPGPPCLALRSRTLTSTQGEIDATARILLHELGHLLGYSHVTGVSGEVHTDNYWTFASGQERLTQFHDKMVRGCVSGSPLGARLPGKRTIHRD